MSKIIITSKAVVMVAVTARLCYRCGYDDSVEDWNRETHYEQVISGRKI